MNPPFQFPVLVLYLNGLVPSIHACDHSKHPFALERAQLTDHVDFNTWDEMRVNEMRWDGMVEMAIHLYMDKFTATMKLNETNFYKTQS